MPRFSLGLLRIVLRLRSSYRSAVLSSVVSPSGTRSRSPQETHKVRASMQTAGFHALLIFLIISFLFITDSFLEITDFFLEIKCLHSDSPYMTSVSCCPKFLMRLLHAPDQCRDYCAPRCIRCSSAGECSYRPHR